MSGRQEQVQAALAALGAEAIGQPCLGCANSAACADLLLACRAFRAWVQGVRSDGKKREPSRRLYLQMMANENG